MHVLKLVMQLFLLWNSSGHEGPGQGVWVPQCIEPPTRVDLAPDHIQWFLLFLAGLQCIITYTSLLLPLSRLLCFLRVFVLVYVASLLGSTHLYARANNSRKFEWLNPLWWSHAFLTGFVVGCVRKWRRLRRKSSEDGGEVGVVVVVAAVVVVVAVETIAVG